MLLRVLGSSAGGGFPQWNCNCPNCTGVRSGSLKALARTQSSIAVSADAQNWLLVNASPDILTQIRQTPQLQPARARRDTGIAAVLLMDAQIDHVTGLLMLREHAVLSDIEDGFPLTRILSHYCGLAAQTIPSDGSRFTVEQLPGLHLEAIALSSKPPPYSPWRNAPRPGDNIGLLMQNPTSGARVFYAPGLGEITEGLLARMAQCDVVLIDGTFWTDDEMQRLGLSAKRAADMGHLAQSGAGGMIEQLDRLPTSTRKILIHINNTNPILVEDSPQRMELARHGIEVAYDGLEISF